MSVLAVLVNPFYYQRRKWDLSLDETTKVYTRALEMIEDARVLVYNSYPRGEMEQYELDLITQLREEREVLTYADLGRRDGEQSLDHLLQRHSPQDVLHVFGEPLVTLPRIALDLQKRIGSRVPVIVIPGCQRDPTQTMKDTLPQIIRRYYSQVDFILESFGNP